MSANAFLDNKPYFLCNPNNQESIKSLEHIVPIEPIEIIEPIKSIVPIETIE